MDRLCGVEVAHIQAKPDLAADGIARVELRRAYHVLLAAQPKQLSLDVVHAQLGINAQTCVERVPVKGQGREEDPPLNIVHHADALDGITATKYTSSA